MDFFAREEHAHRTSRRLVVLFLLAVLGTLVTLNLATYFALNAYISRSALINEAGFRNHRHDADATVTQPADSHSQLPLRLETHAAITLGTIAIILLGSLWKVSQLSGGGASVASMMGGREVGHDPRDAQERMLVNVVEEMSIASGVPMPAVYVLDDEAGVNAFAAGFHSNDAVVAVTRGCIERLDRHELQGVIGHEFSHLLNGDMRFNIRLMGLVHGLLVIGLLGAFLMRMCSWTSDSRRDNRLMIVLLIIGLSTYVIGYIGFFFGGLIKAAISRQREFLADASSVQFTRNPQGLAGALKKLGAGYQSARLENPNSHEASHFFFGNAVSGDFFGLLATHPPLESRILAIDPKWNGDYPEPMPVVHNEEEPAARAASCGSSHQAPHARLDPLTLIARIGTVAPEHVDFSAALLASIPPDVASAAREPYSARAIALCLLLDGDATLAAAPIDEIASRDAGFGSTVRRLHPIVGQLGHAAHLPILDLCIPALRQLSATQRDAFLTEVKACSRLSGARLSAYCMATLLTNRLSDRSPGKGSPGSAILAILPLWPHLQVLLSALARAGIDGPPDQDGLPAAVETNDAKAQAAFQAATQRLLPDRATDQILAAEACGPDQLDSALAGIDRAAPEVKRRVVTACAWCVAADGVVTIAEAELLRVISICLGCPMPPFAPSPPAALSPLAGVPAS